MLLNSRAVTSSTIPQLSLTEPIVGIKEDAVVPAPEISAVNYKVTERWTSHMTFIVVLSVDSLPFSPSGLIPPATILTVLTMKVNKKC